MGANKSFAQIDCQSISICSQCACACGSQKEQGCDAGEIRSFYEGRNKGIHYINKCNSALSGDNAPLMQQLTYDKLREVEGLKPYALSISQIQPIPQPNPIQQVPQAQAGILNQRRRLQKKSMDFEQLSSLQSSHRVTNPKDLISPPTMNKHKKQASHDMKWTSQKKIVLDDKKSEIKQSVAEDSRLSFNVFTPKIIKTVETRKQKVPGINLLNLDNLSIGSSEFFETGKDDILYEGELMKFKPGLTVNFIPRYVQISKRALRYFRSKQESYSGKPLVSIRRTVIESAQPYQINRASYLKPGSAVTKSGKEEQLFDNMFEIVLSQDYEDEFNYRKVEMQIKERKDREQYDKDQKEKQSTQRHRKMLSSVFASNLDVLSNSSTRKHESDRRTKEEERVKIKIRDITEQDGYNSSPGTVGESQPQGSGKNRAKFMKLDYLKGARTTRNFNQSVNVQSTFEKLPKRKIRQQYKKTFNFNHEIYTPRQNTFRILEFERKEVTSERRLSRSPETREQANKPQKKTKVIAGHAMSIRDDRIGPTQDHYLYSTDITEKEFGANDNQGHDSALWKNREKDWYNAERRFIFATRTQRKCQKLIKLISKDTTEPLRIAKSKHNVNAQPKTPRVQLQM